MKDKTLRMIWYALLIIAVVYSVGYRVNKTFINTTYETASIILLAGGFILWFKKDWASNAKPLYYLLFLPMWLMPLLRCRFRIPYLFCHLCPGRCAWGMYRNTLIPLYLLMNVENRFWCWNLCPLGQLQDEAPRKKTVRIPRALTYVRFGILAFALYAIYNIISYTYQVAYTYSIISIIVVAIMLFSSRYAHRPFCNTICPIGAAGDITLWARKKAGI
ncbi:MAG: 4Fe-4S binding protein [Candidatus Altiarchaeota archaeon]